MVDTHRFYGLFMLEAATPLKIGTGKPGLTVDDCVAEDANGLPYIPGSAIRGSIRHALEGIHDSSSVFGYQVGDKGKGARLSVSEARIVGSDGQVVDGLTVLPENDPFYGQFRKKIVRDHCRITHRGVADSQGHGKFDTEAVWKGARFVCSLELRGNEADREVWNAIIRHMCSPLFSLGGGTRKGFGRLVPVRIENRCFNLTDQKDLGDYLALSPRLYCPDPQNTSENNYGHRMEGAAYHQYELSLKPENFFLFGSGHGDADSDNTPKTESIIKWGEDDKPYFSEELIVLPASSIKGAIAHRTAYYYNLMTGQFADTILTANSTESQLPVSEGNVAVRLLFGSAKNSGAETDIEQSGRVFVRDAYIKQFTTKKFDHVAIDRFTGGALQGALFNENTVAMPADSGITVELVVQLADVSEDFASALEAFERALQDVASGMLPLGGGTMKGHGCFEGTITKDGKELVHELVS